MNKKFFLIFILLNSFQLLYCQWNIVFEPDRDISRLSLNGDGFVIVTGVNSNYISYDFGETWSLHLDGLPDEFVATTCYIYSDTLAFIYVLSPPRIYYSVDTGNTWNFRTNSAIEPINDFQMVDDTLGYAVGNGGLFYSTTNSFQTFTFDFVNFSNFQSLYFFDVDTGYIGGTNIMKTTDAGTDWMNVDTIPISSDKIQFLNFKNGYSAGSGYLYKSSNYGNSWQKLNTFEDIPYEIKSFYFLNDSIGYSGGGGSFGFYLVRTNDSGTIWQLNDYPENIYYLYDIKCFNKDTCLAIVGLTYSPYFAILKTTNGGGIASVNNLISNNEIKIYPNPANSNISFQLQNINQSEIGTETINLLSEKINIHWQQTDNHFNADVSQLPKGVYFTIINDGEKKFVGKWVKM